MTHVVTLGFIEKTARLNSITLDPADAPIEDVARMFLGTTDCAGAPCAIFAIESRPRHKDAKLWRQQRVERL